MNLNSVKAFYFGIILTTILIQSFACWKFTEVQDNKNDNLVIKEQFEIIKKLIEKK